jgi:hypothetical protein
MTATKVEKTKIRLKKWIIPVATRTDKTEIRFKT